MKFKFPRSPTPESPPLEKPTAEGKKRESLVIYFLNCTGSYVDLQSIRAHEMRVDEVMYRREGKISCLSTVFILCSCS